MKLISLSALVRWHGFTSQLQKETASRVYPMTKESQTLLTPIKQVAVSDLIAGLNDTTQETAEWVNALERCHSLI